MTRYVSDVWNIFRNEIILVSRDDFQKEEIHYSFRRHVPNWTHTFLTSVRSEIKDDKQVRFLIELKNCIVKLKGRFKYKFEKIPADKRDAIKKAVIDVINELALFIGNETERIKQEKLS